jgi:hypothetical protein
MIKVVGEWIIKLPVELSSNVLITISGNPALTTNLPFTFTGTCGVNYNGIKTKIGCDFSAITSSVQYTLRIKESGILLAGTNFSIIHYGLTTNSSYSTINADIVCYSLVNTNAPTANDIIFKAINIPFLYNQPSYVGQTRLTLDSFTQWTTNKAVLS